MVWLAVAEQLRRFRRYARRVRTDKDPEDIHQLRVSLRRLRAALMLGREALDLPDAVSIDALTRLSRALGRLRDADVALAALEPLVPVAKGAQAEALARAIERLRNRRRAIRRRVRRILGEPELVGAQRGLRRWMRAPHFFAFAFRPLQTAAEPLVEPLARAVSDHPAWEQGSTGGRRSSDDDRVLHDLRKTMKELRYRLEGLARGNPDLHDALLADLRDAQQTLGDLQDIATIESQFQDSEAILLDRRGGLVARHLEPKRQGLLARWQAIVEAAGLRDYRETVRMAAGEEYSNRRATSVGPTILGGPPRR